MAEAVADKGAVKMAADNMQRNLNVLTPEQKAALETANKADHIFKYCQTGRRPQELEWFINDNYHDDREQLRFDTNSNRLVPVPAEKASSRININKAKQLTRGITSYINREHPIVNVWPGPNQTTADSFNNARLEQQLIYHWYDHLQMNSVNKKVTAQGVKYGISWYKVLWDQDAVAPTAPYKVNGKELTTIQGEVWVGHSNTYDVFPDFRATHKGDMRFINEAMPRTIGELASNSRYDQNVVDMIAADDKSALSTLKNSSMNNTYRTAEMAHQTDPMQRTAILRETYVKEFDLDKRQWVIRLYVTTESNLLLLDTEWGLDEFPYEYYQSDIADEIFHSQGAIKDIRGLQSALSRGASQVEETMQVMGKINWLIPRGSGITVITDKTGQFVQYNPAAGQPHQAQPSNLPQYTDKHMSNLERWIDDIGGAHDATYGRLPTSRASGELVDKLQQGDSNSLAMYKDNFEDSQVRVYKLMMKTAKKHYVTSRKVPLNSRDAVGDYQFIELSGKEINLEDKVQVRTGSVLPWDMGDRIQLAKDLYKDGLIGKDAALKMMNLLDLDSIMGNDQQDVERQIKENKDMLGGKDVDDPIIVEDHNAHIRCLDELIKSKKWYDLADKVKQALMDHRQKHVKMSMELRKIEASMNVEPIKRSESFMVRADSTDGMTPVEKQQWYDKFGIDSDAAETQVRGGTFIQDPQEAMNQADLENKLFGEGEFPKVAPQDNHQVHYEMHNALLSSDEFQALPKSQQQRAQEHVNIHARFLQNSKPQAGLVPTTETGIPIPSHTINTKGMKKANRKMAKAAPAPQAPAPEVPEAPAPQ